MSTSLKELKENDFISGTKEALYRATKVFPKDVKINKDVWVGSALSVIDKHDYLKTVFKEKVGKVSFLNCVRLLAMTGLGLGGVKPEAYLIAKGNEFIVVITADGFIARAKRHNGLKNITCQAVGENDEFSGFDACNARIDRHIVRGDKGETIGYYAMAEWDNGSKTTHYMTHQEVVNFKELYAQSKKGGGNLPSWEKSFQQMAFKTCIKKLLRYIALGSCVQELEDVENETAQNIKTVEGRATDIIKTATSEYKQDNAETIGLMEKPKLKVKAKEVKETSDLNEI